LQISGGLNRQDAKSAKKRFVFSLPETAPPGKKQTLAFSQMFRVQIWKSAVLAAVADF